MSDLLTTLRSAGDHDSDGAFTVDAAGAAKAGMLAEDPHMRPDLVEAIQALTVACERVARAADTDPLYATGLLVADAASRVARLMATLLLWGWLRFVVPQTLTDADLPPTVDHDTKGTESHG